MTGEKFFSKEKLKSGFSDMSFKDYATLFFAIISICVMLFMYFLPIQPTEIIKDNPKINLHDTLISNEILYELENYQESIYTQKDELENININKNNNILTLKFLETDDSKRFIIVLLSDPNNMIRFSNIKFEKNNTNDFDINKSAIHEITIKNNIKINIPHYYNYISGTWHLNVYLYNTEKELTAVISKPIDYK